MEKKNISVDDQLESIHAMLADGHKSIQLERHTLPLWGGGIAFLIAFAHDISIPVYQFGQFWGKSFHIGLIASVLLAIIWIDHRLTSAARVMRDESISFIQRKVTLTIWLLFAFAFLLDIYAGIYLGGGHRLSGVYLVLSGIVLTMFGLYSEYWYRWSGIVLMLLGAGVMFMLQPGNTTQLLTASIFLSAGFAIAYLQPFATSKKRCALLSAVWVSAALLLSVLAYQLDYYLDISADGKSIMPWSEFQKQQPSGKRIVRLSPGTEIPVDISVTGDVFAGASSARLGLKIVKQIDVEFDDGKPTGTYRINAGPWLEQKDAMFTRKLVRETILNKPWGPELVRKLEIGTQRRVGGLLGE